MKHTDASDDPSDESRVDDLLRDFFAGEMPAEIKRLETSTPRPQIRAAVRAPGSRRPAIFQLAAMSLCVVFAGLALWLATTRKNEPTGPVSGVLDTGKAAVQGGIPNVVQAASRPAGFSLSQNVEPVESLSYDTLNGPVQQRTNVSTTSVSFIEPGTGDLLEVVLPELTIEIFPIEDGPATGNKTPRTELDKKPNGAGQPVLLPEQQSGSSPRP